MKSLADQIKCAKRELALRRSAYPRWIARGTLKQADADHEIESMEAIVATLEKLKMLEEVGDEMKAQTFWCTVHNRLATFRNDRGPCCDPSLAGITAPCQVTAPEPEPEDPFN